MVSSFDEPSYKATFDNMWLPDPVEVAKGMPDWTKRWQREVAR